MKKSVEKLKINHKSWLVSADVDGRAEYDENKNELILRIDQKFSRESS